MTKRFIPHITDQTPATDGGVCYAVAGELACARTGSHDLGRWGESLAAHFVESLGWTVLVRNWRADFGELDLVAFDPDALYVVAVEVKTRSTTGFGTPLEAITEEKMCRLRGLIAQWHRENEEYHGFPVRIDVIGILKPAGSSPRITHVRAVS